MFNVDTVPTSLEQRKKNLCFFPLKSAVLFEQAKLASFCALGKKYRFLAAEVQSAGFLWFVSFARAKEMNNNK